MKKRCTNKPTHPGIMRDDAFQRRKCVERAIEKFNKDESYLLEHRPSERCICARFAIYLEAEVRERISGEYVADIEYNKGMEDNNDLKKMLHGKRIYPDLIVHKRGERSRLRVRQHDLH